MLKKKEKQFLTNITKGRILFDQDLSTYTSFLIGGPGDAVVFPNNYQEITQFVIKVSHMNIPLTVLGGGSNILIKDKGIKGIVMILSNMGSSPSFVKKNDYLEVIKVHPGVKLQEVCNFAIKNNLWGINFALGIPGTIGGAIATNAGTSGGSILDIVQSITILDKNNEVKKITNISNNFSYRNLFQNERTNLILECELGLAKGNSKYIREEAKDYLVKRKKTQPRSSASAGCFFRNPRKNLSAGKLIDKVGLKGKQIGGAIISEKHANFIINQSRATASDVLKLADLVRELVFKHFSIVLEPEVCILGH